jgi:hypothetical protein
VTGTWPRQSSPESAARPEIEDIVISAGSAEAQSDTISVNIDYTNITKGEVLLLLSKIRDAIHNAPFPPL